MTETPAASRLIRLGLLGAVLAISGFGLFNALFIPPFRWPDEQAHAGYAITLTRGELPTIETIIPRPEGSEALSRRLDLDSRPRGTVWVANHPPGGYLLALPMVAAADRMGHGDLTNLALRLANIAAGAMTALLTFALGRELVDERVGLIAAAVFVSFSCTSFLLALGMTDGISLVATAAAVLAAVRLLGRRADLKSWIAMSAALLACGLTRLTALGVGLLLASVTLVVVARRERRVPWREALLVGLPVTVLSGWFWVGNAVRYGDVAGSKYLLQRFDRTPNGSLLDILRRGDIWEETARRLLTTLTAEATQNRFGRFGDVPFRLAEAFVVVCVVSVLVLIVRDQRSAAPPPPLGERKLEPWPWAALLLTVIVSWVMMAKHVSGGGNAIARYVIIALPLLGVTVATAILRVKATRAAGRYLPSAVAVTTIVFLFSLRVQQTLKFMMWISTRTDPPAGGLLSQPTGPQWLRLAAMVIGVIGTALMTWIVGVIAVQPLPATAGADRSSSYQAR